MTGILTLLGLAVGLLHLIGGFVGFVWLLVLRDWEMVALGLMALFFARQVIPAVLVPGLWLFGTPAAILQKGPHRRLARAFYALLGANTVVVMGAWCFLWASIFLHTFDPELRIPRLLWGYAVAVGPWAGLAREGAQQEAARAQAEGREPEFPGAQSVTFLVQLAFICGGVAWLGGWTSFHMAALPLWSLALVLMASIAVRQHESLRPPHVRRMAPPGAATIEGEGGVRADDGDRHQEG